MEPQDLLFTLLGFILALIQYFLTMPQFLPFGMVMYVLCHCILEICNIFRFYRCFQFRVCFESHKTLDFETVLRLNENMDFFEVRLYTFCIMIGPQGYGGQEVECTNLSTWFPVGKIGKK